MRILADENFPHALVQALRLEGHDVLETGKDVPSRSDRLLLEAAEDLGRIVFTLDNDFWQIALQRRQPLIASGVLLFRVHPATPNNLWRLTQRILQMKESWIGQVALITPQGIDMVGSGSGRRSLQNTDQKS